MSNGDRLLGSERSGDDSVITENERDSIQKRAELGKGILEKNRAQGKPGTKQPVREDNPNENEETVSAINELLEGIAVPTKKSSAEKSKESGNLNETPPEERTLSQENIAKTQHLSAAAGHLAAAKVALETQAVSDARLLSDPRYERDQKILELAQTGKLGFVPPAPEEIAAQNATLPPAVLREMPKTVEEQVERDMERLNIAEERAKDADVLLNPTVSIDEKNAALRREVTDRQLASVPSTVNPATTKEGQVRESAQGQEANTVRDPGNTLSTPKQSIFGGGAAKE